MLRLTFGLLFPAGTGCYREKERRGEKDRKVGKGEIEKQKGRIGNSKGEENRITVNKRPERGRRDRNVYASVSEHYEPDLGYKTFKLLNAHTHNTHTDQIRTYTAMQRHLIVGAFLASVWSTSTGISSHR